jgi:hypothetical protein
MLNYFDIKTSDPSNKRAKKTVGAAPLFLTAAPAGQTLGTTFELFPEVGFFGTTPPKRCISVGESL